MDDSTSDNLTAVAVDGGPASKAAPRGIERAKIIVADDEPLARRVLCRHLQEAGYEPLAAENGRQAMDLMCDDILLALLDLKMPGADGLECLRYIRKEYPDTEAIMISGAGQIADAVAAMKEGAFDYLTKPFEPEKVMVRVNQAVRAARLARDNRDLRQAVDCPIPSPRFVAKTPVAQKLLSQVQRVARVDSTVVLLGESGTGKTTIARMIHQTGPRKDAPFVAVNCASLPRDLIEAELFGHARGAFTGAVKDRPGRAEIADGGTFFLDEIGDLPLELQPKLLTFLQDRTFQRIGSNKVQNVDVRMIVATHQDLLAMCRKKLFREDLFFRLSVLAVHIPPLRERMGDIPELSRRILDGIARRYGFPPWEIDGRVFAKLRGHNWPGNIRELENVLERASAFCEGPIIGEEDITFDSIIESVS